MSTRRLVVTVLLALGLPLLQLRPAAGDDNPYRRIPAMGESVRLSGAAGGASQAWTYYQRAMLERFLRLTIDAASARASYTDMEDEIGRLAKLVVAVDNGIRATIEDIKPYNYRGRGDIEVRVQLKEGRMIGKDLWTTLGELLDGSGRSFIR
jgi:hypothetical protein